MRNKSKVTSKSELKIRIGKFFSYKKTTVKTFEETSDKKSKKRKLFSVICSMTVEIIKIIIKVLFTAIISAVLNGLFYIRLILNKNEFFLRGKWIYD